MRIGTYLIILGFVVAMTTLLAVLGYAPLQTGGAGALYVIMAGIPLFLLYGASRTCLPDQSWMTCLCVAPCAIGFPGLMAYHVYTNEMGYATATDSAQTDLRFFGPNRTTSDTNTAILTLFFGVPIAVVAWSVLWRLRGHAEAGSGAASAHAQGGESAAESGPSNSKLLMATAAACCLLVFFPMGILVPIVSVLEMDRSAAAEAAMGLSLGAMMFCVTLCAMIINMCLKALEAEKNAKTSIYRLRDQLRDKRVLIKPKHARNVYEAHAATCKENSEHGAIGQPDHPDYVSFRNRITNGYGMSNGWGIWFDPDRHVGQILPIDEVHAIEEAQRLAEEERLAEEARVLAEQEAARAAAIEAGLAQEEADKAAEAAKLEAEAAGSGETAQMRLAMMMRWHSEENDEDEDMDGESHKVDTAPSLLDTWREDCARLGDQAKKPFIELSHGCSRCCERCCTCNCCGDLPEDEELLDGDLASSIVNLQDPDAIDARNMLMQRIFNFYAKGDALMSAGEFCHFLIDSMLEGSTRAMLPNSLTSRVFHSLTVHSVTAILNWVRLNVGHTFNAWSKIVQEKSLRRSATDADGAAHHKQKVLAQLIYEYLKEPVYDWENKLEPQANEKGELFTEGLKERLEKLMVDKDRDSASQGNAHANFVRVKSHHDGVAGTVHDASMYLEATDAAMMRRIIHAHGSLKADAPWQEHFEVIVHGRDVHRKKRHDKLGFAMQANVEAHVLKRDTFVELCTTSPIKLEMVLKNLQNESMITLAQEEMESAMVDVHAAGNITTKDLAFLLLSQGVATAQETGENIAQALLDGKNIDEIEDMDENHNLDSMELAGLIRVAYRLRDSERVRHLVIHRAETMVDKADKCGEELLMKEAVVDIVASLRSLDGRIWEASEQMIALTGEREWDDDEISNFAIAMLEEGCHVAALAQGLNLGRCFYALMSSIRTQDEEDSLSYVAFRQVLRELCIENDKGNAALRLSQSEQGQHPNKWNKAAQHNIYWTSEMCEYFDERVKPFAQKTEMSGDTKFTQILSNVVDVFDMMDDTEYVNADDYIQNIKEVDERQSTTQYEESFFCLTFYSDF